MKIRNGFVSNSSSTSFIIRLNHKPTPFDKDIICKEPVHTAEEVIQWLSDYGYNYSDADFAWIHEEMADPKYFIILEVDRDRRYEIEYLESLPYQSIQLFD